MQDSYTMCKSVYIRMCVCKFTNARTNTHTYIHTYVYAYINTYIYAYRKEMTTGWHTHTQTYIHTCMHTYRKGMTTGWGNISSQEAQCPQNTCCYISATLSSKYTYMHVLVYVCVCVSACMCVCVFIVDIVPSEHLLLYFCHPLK